MTAEEFKIEWKLNRKFGFAISDLTWVGFVYTDIEMNEFAEAYHKHEVEAISDDEDILYDSDFVKSCEEWANSSDDLAGIDYASFGFNYLRNKLLKQ